MLVKNLFFFFTMAEIITSGTGGTKLLLNGFVYYKTRKYKDRTYWECRRMKQNKECNARAITTQSNTTNRINVVKGGDQSDHSHPPSVEEAEAERIKNQLKRKAEEHPEAGPAQILRTELQNVPSGVLAFLPDRENLKKSMRREKKKKLPTEPTSLEDLEQIPERFRKTLMGDLFLIYDSNEDDEAEIGEKNRVLVFSTRRNLELLMVSETWFADGTFKTSPLIFTQIFTLIGIVKGGGFAGRREESDEDEDEEEDVVGQTDLHKAALPFVFAFLTSKEQALYTLVFQKVLHVAEDIYHINIVSPPYVMSDFELAINATRDTLQNTTVRCCFFHLGQSVYRRVQAEGLQEAYNNPDDRSVKEAIHMTLALALVPENDVVAAFEELRDEVPESTLPVMDYFERNYVIGVKARGRRARAPPRYPIPLWNQYEAARTNKHKTNNLSEGWHNRFQQVIGKHHPSLYYAFTEVLKEQGDTETMIRELALGKSVKAKQKKKWLVLQNRLRMIVLQYEDYKSSNRRMDYLRTVGHNIRL